MFKIEAAKIRATRASADAYEFVKRREALKIDENGVAIPANKAFQDKGDLVTIGFGHTTEIETAHGRRRPALGDVITTEYAHTLFDEVDAPEAEALIDKHMADIPLTQGQRDAMFSFVFNIRRKWLDPKNNTFLRHWKAGTLTFEILLEYLPQYRNARTIFEEGLFRRRLAELCMIIGIPPLIAEKHAWQASLWRDKNNEIKHRTDPLLIVLQAEQEVRKSEPKSSPAAKAVESSSSALDKDEAAPGMTPAEPGSPVTVSTPDPEPVKEKKPADLEDKPKPKQKPRRTTNAPKRAIKYPKPRAPRPDEKQMTRPEFWSMNMLIFGRLALALGMIPAAATDLILDPNFQAAAGGVIAIYVAMYFQRRNSKERQQREQTQRREDMRDALDGLRQQYDLGVIDFDTYEAEVRELTT